MSERTIVAIGCSTYRDYDFLAPLSALLWRDAIGHIPVVFLTGSKEARQADRRTAVSLAALEELGIEHHFVEAEGYQEHTIAQNVRQHASALASIDDNDWVMPADADLWPIRRDYYHMHVDTAHKVVCLYANGDHFQSKERVLERASQGLGDQTIPTCHVIMRAKDWRCIYGLTVGDVGGSVKRSLDAWLPHRQPTNDPNMVLWMSDQQMMTEALCQQHWFPANAYMVNRHGHPPVDRLDRGEPHWGTFDASKWIDAHLHKAPESDEHWAAEAQIIDALIPQQSAWARQYRDRYAEASR